MILKLDKEYKGATQLKNIIRIQQPTIDDEGQVLFNKKKYTIRNLKKGNNLESFFEEKAEIIAENKVVGTIEPKYKMRKTIFYSKPKSLHYKFKFNDYLFMVYDVISNGNHHICIFNQKNESLGLIEQTKTGEFVIYSIYAADIIPFALLLLYFNSMQLLKNKKIIQRHELTSHNNKDKYDSDFIKRVEVLDKIAA